jgi:hypothetical protein
VVDAANEPVVIEPLPMTVLVPSAKKTVKLVQETTTLPTPPGALAVNENMLALVPTIWLGKQPPVASTPDFVVSILFEVNARFTTRPNVIPSFRLSWLGVAVIASSVLIGTCCSTPDTRATAVLEFIVVTPVAATAAVADAATAVALAATAVLLASLAVVAAFAATVKMGLAILVAWLAAEAFPPTLARGGKGATRFCGVALLYQSRSESGCVTMLVGSGLRSSGDLPGIFG